MRIGLPAVALGVSAWSPSRLLDRSPWGVFLVFGTGAPVRGACVALRMPGCCRARRSGIQRGTAVLTARRAPDIGAAGRTR
jgi:hypothetical protein